MRREFERVTLDVEDSLAILSFNRPKALNALSPSMIHEARAALDLLANNVIKARALVLTGAGRAFCSGADLPAQAFPDEAEQRDAGKTLELDFHPFLLALRALPFPFITAVNGGAAGAGMGIALSGDMILASESAYFLQAFVHLGVVPDAGSTYLLTRLVGRPRAMELSMLGEKLSAQRALEWGMVNRVVPDDELMNEAKKLGHRLATGPTVAHALTRDLYWRAEDAGYESQLQNERMFQRTVGRTRDASEGVRAFLEKRRAVYSGE